MSLTRKLSLGCLAKLMDFMTGDVIEIKINDNECGQITTYRYVI